MLDVRELNRTDSKSLREFDEGLSERSHRLFFPHKYDDDTLRKVLMRAESGEDFVRGAFDGSRLIGYFFLWYFEEPVPLLGIGITDEFHRLGLGTQMMTILMDKARRAAKGGIELTTMQDNDAAFALYQKMGFIHFRNVENVIGDGTVVIERAMFFTIVPGAKPMEREHRPPV